MADPSEPDRLAAHITRTPSTQLTNLPSEFGPARPSATECADLPLSKRLAPRGTSGCIAALRPRPSARADSKKALPPGSSPHTRSRPNSKHSRLEVHAPPLRVLTPERPALWSSQLRRAARPRPSPTAQTRTLGADATAIGERTLSLVVEGLPISAFPGLLSSALTVTLLDALLANN